MKCFVSILFVSILSVYNFLSGQPIVRPNKPLHPISTSSPVSSPSSSLRKVKFNLVIMTDSACKVRITSFSGPLEVKSFDMQKGEIKQLKVPQGGYRVQGMSLNPSLLEFDEVNRQVSEQKTELVVIKFDSRQLVKDTVKPQWRNDTVAKLPRYKDLVVEKICNDLVLVEGGTFVMGEDERGSKNGPAHEVSISNYLISAFEISHAQFAHFVSKAKYVTDAQKNDGGFVASGGRRKEVNFGFDASGNLRNLENTHEPVLYVSWDDANAFCKWLSAETKREFQLPTEAQWEYAARGGNSSNALTYAGSGKPEEVAWYAENSGNHTHRVGALKPNELGLYDMSGNAWEWCRDWFDKDYYRTSPANSPNGAKKGTKRSIRGGSWRSNSAELKTTYRSLATPYEGFYSIGFRVVTVNP